MDTYPCGHPRHVYENPFDDEAPAAPAVGEKCDTCGVERMYALLLRLGSVDHVGIGAAAQLYYRLPEADHDALERIVRVLERCDDDDGE